MPLADSQTCRQVLEAAESLSPRMIYCFFLAVGIYISTLRQQRRRGQANLPS